MALSRPVLEHWFHFYHMNFIKNVGSGGREKHLKALLRNNQTFLYIRSKGREIELHRKRLKEYGLLFTFVENF